MLKFYYVYWTRKISRKGSIFTEHCIRLYLLADGELKHIVSMRDKFTGEMQLAVEAAVLHGALPNECKRMSAGMLEAQGIAKFTSL